MKSVGSDDINILEHEESVETVITEVSNTDKHEEAFYICDLGDIIIKQSIFAKKMPRVKPFYAVKCNDSNMVLKLLADLGTNFDCASKEEIRKILSLGVETSRIIFANPAKPASHIKYAQSVNVDLMTIDSESELYKIINLYPNARLIVRIRCEAAKAQCPLGMKFGCDPVSEAPNIIRQAIKCKACVVGISFHVGSGCAEPKVFRRAITMAKKLFDMTENELGIKLEILDIGGGFPGDKGTSIDKIGDIINDALEEYFPDKSVNIIAEPGRFFVSSAYTLACNVHSMKVTALKLQSDIEDNANYVKHYMYYINDGVYGSFNCILYDHQKVEAKTLKSYSNNVLYWSSVWGPTCDGLDQVIESVLLPKLDIGDWLIFENMGAYTIPVASPFNGFPVPIVYYVLDKKFKFHSHRLNFYKF